MNGTTRDVCNASAFLNEKTQHSHRQVAANLVKTHPKITHVSANPIQMHTKIWRALKFRVRLRPKAYRTKRTLGHCPYREKHDIPINGSQKTSENCIKISTRLRNCLPQTAAHKHRITQISTKYANNTYKT